MARKGAKKSKITQVACFPLKERSALDRKNGLVQEGFTRQQAQCAEKNRVIRLLTPMHITSEVYGTRCATVFTVRKDGKITYEERVFVPKNGIERFEFKVG